MILNFNLRYKNADISAQSVLSALGFTEQQVLEIMPSEADTDGYLAMSGSMVEGLSHASSDIDIYCIGNHPTQTIIGNIKDTRVDFELIERSEVDRLISRFLKSDVKGLDYSFSFDDLQKIYRILISKPLAASNLAYGAIIPQNLETKLNEHMRRYWKYGVNTYLNDAVGALQSDEPDYALVRSVHALEASIDYYLACLGDGNPQNKYRNMKLRRVLGVQNEIFPYYRSFRSKWPTDLVELKTFVAEIMFSTKLLLLQNDLFTQGSAALALFKSEKYQDHPRYLLSPETRLIVDHDSIDIASYLKAYTGEKTIRLNPTASLALVSLLLGQSPYEVLKLTLQTQSVADIPKFVRELTYVTNYLISKGLVYAVT